jgi:hypothetical protein
LKLVYPQPGVDPARFEGLAFEHFLLQPMDGPARLENTLPSSKSPRPRSSTPPTACPTVRAATIAACMGTRFRSRRRCAVPCRAPSAGWRIWAR